VTAQYWLGRTALWSADAAGSFGHFTAVCDAVADGGPSRPLAEALQGRAAALVSMGRLAEGEADARRALAMAREIGHPRMELLALGGLSLAALHGGDRRRAPQLARQAEQAQAGVTGPAGRMSSYLMINQAKRQSRRRGAARAGRDCGVLAGRVQSPHDPHIVRRPSTPALVLLVRSVFRLIRAGA